MLEVKLKLTKHAKDIMVKRGLVNLSFSAS